MEQAKRRKPNDRPIDFSNIDDIIELDPHDSESEYDISEIDELTVSSSKSHKINDEMQVDEKMEEKEKLKDLLMEWGVSSLMDNLISCGFNCKNLVYLEDGDYFMLMKNDFSKMADIAKFRHFHRKWKSCVDRHSIEEERINNVEHILENGGEMAKELTSFYEKNEFLTDPLREGLVDLILKVKRKISRTILSNIADQICKVFPTERKTVYYEKLRSKEPTGLLYRKYNISRETKNRRRTSDESQAESLENIDALLTDEVRKSVDFLNSEESFGKDKDTTLIIHHWNSTFSYRYAKTYISAQEAINDWLPLRKVDATVLVHLDFVAKYGSEAAGSLVAKWDNFTFRNHHEILNGIRDPTVRKSVTSANSESDINLKNRVYMMALHNLSFTVPTKVTLKGNVNWTPTIPESKDSFLMIMKNSAEMKKRLTFQHNICALKKIQKHTIIFEFNDNDKISYLIALEDTIYECNSLIDAVDDAFKLFVMLNIPFPPQSVKVWLFLNELFYKITLPQKASAKTVSMLNSYQT